MTLTLTAVVCPNYTESGDVALTDGVNLLDLHMWSHAEPLETSITNISASDVAKELYLRASQTQLTQTAQKNTLCFRYGPRPPDHLNSFLFHERGCCTECKGSNAPPVAEVPLGCTLPSLILPSSSSVDLLADVSGQTNAHDSLFALWLWELLSEPNNTVTVTALLLFVEGTTVDLLTGSELHTPFKVDIGTVKQLRNHEDALAFLHACEARIRHSAATCPRCPYHVCITVYVGTDGDRDGKSAVTFLDVASTALESEDANAQVRLQQQLTLFARQLGIEAATTTTPSPTSLTLNAADQRWLDLLQSRQLSRARLLGLVCVGCEAWQGFFRCAGVHGDGHDRLTLARALCQRELSGTANKSPLHPQLPQPPPTQERATPQRAKPANTAPWIVPDPLPNLQLSGRRSQQNDEKSSHLKHIASVRFGSDALEASAHHSDKWHVVSGAATHRDRFGRLLKHIECEEHHARLVLSGAEQRARRLAEIRWVLRARPPGKCIEAVLRWLENHVDRKSRPEPLLLDYSASSCHSRPRLGTTQPLLSINRPPARTAQRLPTLALPALPSHRPSEAHLHSSRIESQLLCCTTGSTPKRRGGPQAHSASPRAGAQTYTVVGLKRRYQAPHLTNMDLTPVRRRSATEVALLVRQRAVDRMSSPPHSPRKGEIMRLYPLVQAFHIKITEQDTMMAEELMMRSRIEHREKNRRQALSAASAASLQRSLALWPSESRAEQLSIPRPIRRCSVQPPSRRIFFTC
ncbi:hypothetical protein JKF63_07192 [Porcisia hertigi]|uniref:Uncharacterized protein n=1 Tax=Porcisia hertigi TaxID=2761500 RepID=A0A836LKH7_9TRYP|nr:hypothetical protein JKF63_07192 [Porcisia hertigi]